MNGILAYILLYVSAAFYCGFNTAVKEKAAEHLNDTKIQSIFPLEGDSFNFDCEALACLTKSLKLYNDEGFVIEDGWLTVAGIFTSYNTTAVDLTKENLGKCIPEVNRKLVIYPKCRKYRVGFELLNACVDTKLVKFKIDNNL